MAIHLHRSDRLFNSRTGGLPFRSSRNFRLLGGTTPLVSPVCLTAQFFIKLQFFRGSGELICLFDLLRAGLTWIQHIFAL